MKTEYDFSKSRKNPYTVKLKRQVTIRLDEPTIEYFKQLADESGIGCQNLINLYLRDCAERKKKLNFQWKLKRRNKGVGINGPAPFSFLSSVAAFPS